MHKKQILSYRPLCILAVLFFSSCANVRVSAPRRITPAEYWGKRAAAVPLARANRIIGVLDSVLVKSRRIKDLNSFGIRTMKESVVILTNMKYATPLVAQALLRTGRWSAVLNDSDWRFRYWVTDMAGYMKTGDISEVLYSIALDGAEHTDIRIRAVKSLCGLKEKKRLKEIFMKAGNTKVREETARSLLYLD